MSRKSGLLLFCIIVLAAITVLASSLHDVHFQPGRSLLIRSSTETPVLFQVPETFSDTPLWKILLFWLAFVINLFLFFYLLPPNVRKKIVRQVISFSVGSFILLLSLKYRLIQLPNLNTDPVNVPGQPPSGEISGSLPPTFSPPQITPLMAYIVSLGLFLGFLLLGWFIYRWWTRSQGRRFSSLGAIANIAQSSLDDLASGREWGDVIIQSYARMNKVVSDQRGLQRLESTTPREFAVRLEKAGLPADSVNRLTRLFESVRYGSRRSNQSDINEAVACLNSILQACGMSQ